MHVTRFASWRQSSNFYVVMRIRGRPNSFPMLHATGIAPSGSRCVSTCGRLQVRCCGVRSGALPKRVIVLSYIFSDLRLHKGTCSRRAPRPISSFPRIFLFSRQRQSGEDPCTGCGDWRHSRGTCLQLVASSPVPYYCYKSRTGLKSKSCDIRGLDSAAWILVTSGTPAARGCP
ncbi:hypothetical protein BDY21DRAFT_185046 [Lineolata rhizophorae]|uniref:Uncharacterized protein n=1 Tax=Lineolata rhizophorae TaxID=578093 RepID=A0A6A6P842_9PEZI|nr:hypothetical protein BDY21DRAFT_185046 [Lineolata rhizophorae]